MSLRRVKAGTLGECETGPEGLVEGRVDSGSAGAGMKKQSKGYNADTAVVVVVVVAVVDETPAGKDTKAGSVVVGHRAAMDQVHGDEDGGKPYSPEKTSHSEVPTYMAPRAVFAAGVSAAAHAARGADGGSSCPSPLLSSFPDLTDCQTLP